jgi:protein-disulfide isomerase
MDSWCQEIGIAYTPTFFVNGYQLPKMYKIEDLKYLMS